MAFQGISSQQLSNLPKQPGVYIFRDKTKKPIYIGKAKSLRNRVRSYFQKSKHSLKTEEMIRRIANLETMVVSSETEALILEANLIKEHQPYFNVRMRDDKTYPYIKVTMGESFPRVLVTRKLRKDGSKYFGPYTSIRQMRAALNLIKKLYTVRSCHYKLPGETPQRPCLDYHIGLCQAPCVGKQDSVSYGSMIKEILDVLAGNTSKAKNRIEKLMQEAVRDLKFEQAGKLRDVLVGLEVIVQKQKVERLKGGNVDAIGLATKDGKGFVVVMQIRKGVLISRGIHVMEKVEAVKQEEILENFATSYYLGKNKNESVGFPEQILVPAQPLDSNLIERAISNASGRKVQFLVPQKGANKNLLLLARENAEHVISNAFIEKSSTGELNEELLEDMRDRLGLKILPRLMACVDISHHQGRETVGSIVVFRNSEPEKTEYRKMKIKGHDGNDDYLSMAEVVRRYFTRKMNENTLLPDLLILDGGKGQLSTVVRELKSIGLKDLEVLSIAKKNEELFIFGQKDSLILERKDPVLRLLQRIRDEAHRFALTYSKHLRSKNFLESRLSGIPGVGKARERSLLRHFGSVKGIEKATVEEISKLPGISGTLANRISTYLSGSNGG